MPWMVTAHIIFILMWSAGLLGLIYMLAAHHDEHDPQQTEFYRIIERKLYFHLATPAAVLSVLTGLWLLFSRGFEGGWLPVKLVLVSLMVAAHAYSGDRKSTRLNSSHVRISYAVFCLKKKKKNKKIN